jgi:hypothetical protein
LWILGMLATKTTNGAPPEAPRLKEKDILF